MGELDLVVLDLDDSAGHRCAQSGRRAEHACHQGHGRTGEQRCNPERLLGLRRKPREPLVDQRGKARREAQLSGWSVEEIWW